MWLRNIALQRRARDVPIKSRSSSHMEELPKSQGFVSRTIDRPYKSVAGDNSNCSNLAYPHRAPKGMTRICGHHILLILREIQGISKRLFPGCENLGLENSVFLPAEDKQNTTFSPGFSKPGKSLIEIPCTCYPTSKNMLDPQVITDRPYGSPASLGRGRSG